jgi:hypothetical protein
MYEKADEPSLSGGPELWVRVLTNEMVDLPRVKAAIADDQAEIWAGYADKPSDYYPHWVTPEEKTEHGFKYEDWFIFPKKRSY